MQNLFVSKDDEFVIKITVATDDTGMIFCDLNEESLRASMSGMANLEQCEIKTYKTVFKKPSFGDTMVLYDSIFSVTDAAAVSFNPVEARYKKISALIKNWDLKGKEEKPTDAEISELHPVIANAIGIQIDLETGGLLS